MKDVIPIDRYDAVIKDGTIQYEAVKGKTRYPMSDAFKDMYTDEYLAISEVSLAMPELYGLPDGSTVYIPRRTS